MIVSDIVLTSLLVLQMLFVGFLSIQTVFLSLVIRSRVSLFLKILLQIFDSIHIILILILLLFVLLVLVNSLSCLSFLDLVSIHHFLLRVLKILCFVLPIYIYLVLALNLLLSISLVFSLYVLDVLRMFLSISLYHQCILLQIHLTNPLVFRSSFFEMLVVHSLIQTALH